MVYDPAAARMALVTVRTMDMFRKNRDTLHPVFDPDLASAYELRGYLAASDTLVTVDPVTQKRRLTPAQSRVFYGFAATATDEPNRSVVVIRGTGDLSEWVKDGEFSLVKHPYGGFVEYGFYSIYSSMTFEPYVDGQFTGQPVPIAQGVAHALRQGQIELVGHSLGSAQATYLAIDLLLGEQAGDRVSALLLASPRTGDIGFVEMVDRNLRDYTLYDYWRDLVPRVPAPLYLPLPRETVFQANEAQAQIRFDWLDPWSLANLGCQHHAVCYAAMLDYAAADWSRLPDHEDVACIIGPRSDARAAAAAPYTTPWQPPDYSLQ